MAEELKKKTKKTKPTKKPRGAFIPVASRREASSVGLPAWSPQCCGRIPSSPGGPCTGEADFSLTARKLFLVEGSPKSQEFQPRAVYFLYFCRFHLWFRGIQAQLEPLPLTHQNPARQHQDPLPGQLGKPPALKPGQRQRALPRTPSSHRGDGQGQELPGKGLRETGSHHQARREASPKAILAEGTNSTPSRPFLASGKIGLSKGAVEQLSPPSHPLPPPEQTPIALRPISSKRLCLINWLQRISGNKLEEGGRQILIVN